MNYFPFWYYRCYTTGNSLSLKEVCPVFTQTKMQHRPEAMSRECMIANYKTVEKMPLWQRVAFILSGLFEKCFFITMYLDNSLFTMYKVNNSLLHSNCRGCVACCIVPGFRNSTTSTCQVLVIPLSGTFAWFPGMNKKTTIIIEDKRYNNNNNDDDDDVTQNGNADICRTSKGGGQIKL